jgi:hypothetical protein
MSESSPVLNLLASGLQLWVRQQCDAVESLELQLHGSALGLLRGRLEGVSLVARRVVYAALEIEMVELRSSAIQVQLGNLLKGQAVQLHHAFQIEGYVAFTAAGLGRSLCMAQWRSLGDQLAESAAPRGSSGWPCPATPTSRSARPTWRVACCNCMERRGFRLRAPVSP